IRKTSRSPLLTHGPGGIMLNRANMTLAEVQCHLNRQGAANLVIELIMKNPSHSIFVESVELGIALLEGGNTIIQRSILTCLSEAYLAEQFFKVFYDKLKSAQAEIKSSANVTSDFTTKTVDSSRNLHQTTVKEFRKKVGRQNGTTALSDDIKAELHDAAMATNKAYNCMKRQNNSNLSENGLNSPGQVSSPLDDMLAEKEKSKDAAEENKLPLEVLVMQPILRFLQLLCENHNCELQVNNELH
ncbi:Uncharacterised protein g11412, partial [Pycnogonum litorale]